MPPQTRTISPFSKKRKLRPMCSLSVVRQCRTSGNTSRSSAATIATLGIPIRPKPLHRAPQRTFYQDDLPAQFALCLVGAGKHLFPAHANRIDSGSRLAMQYPTGNCFINHARGKGKYIRQLHSRRRQYREAWQPVEKLLPPKVLTPQQV